MTRRLACLLLSFFSVSISLAQLRDIKSIRQQLRTDLPDTTRILLLCDLSYELRRSQPDSSLLLARQAMALSEEIRYDKGKGRAKRVAGIYHFLKGDYPTASDLYSQALAYARSSGDKKNIANCLNNIGNIYHSQSNYPEAIDYFLKSLALRQEIRDSLGMAQCYSNIGSVYNDKGDYEHALIYLKEALKVCEEINNKEGIASSYNNIGSTYKSQGNYNKALEYFLLSAKNIVLRDDKPAMAFAYNDIGNVYKDQGNYEKALEFFFDALKLFEEVDSKQGIAATLTHIGNIYKDQQNHEKALEYFTNALAIKQKLGDKRGIANSYNDIGQVYEARHDPLKSLEHLERALALQEEIGDRRGTVLTCINIADVHLQAGMTSRALPFLQRCQRIANDISSDDIKALLEAKYAQYYNETKNPHAAKEHALHSLALAKKIGKVEYARNAAEQLYIANAAMKNFQEAFAYHKFFITLRDSIQNEKNNRFSLAREFAFKEQKVKNEEEKRLLEFKAAEERQKRITFTLAAISITVIILSLLIYRSNRQKQKANKELLLQKKETETAKEELEKLNGIKNRLLSIISHDVRGPLNSLKAILHLFNSNGLSQEEFNDVVSNVGHQVGQVNYLLDNLLRWTKNQLDQVKPQPKNLNLQDTVIETIELLTLSAKSKKIHVESYVPESLMVYSDEEMIKLVIRNLLSNAIKFCEANDTVRVRAKTNGKLAIIYVEDTGKGISPENLKLLFGLTHLTTKGTNEEIGTGLGLTLCKEFVEKCGGTISVSSEEGKGSCFEFTTPLAM